MFRSSDVRRVISLALLGGWPLLARAGDLNPPPGPITSTMKTLSQVEPRTPIGADTTPGGGSVLYRITQPGSYYLTGNISTNLTAVEIAASHVTLDLMGFDIAGAGASDGVRAAEGVENIVVRNGTVRNFGDGIDLSDATNKRIENVTAAGNASFGITAGSGASIVNCTLRNNSFIGVMAQGGAILTNCTAIDNPNIGFFVDGAVVNGCLVTGSPNFGIFSFGESTFSGCSLIGNGQGMFAGTRSVISNCTASSNDLDGIVTSAGSTIIGCTAAGNGGDGFEVAGDCVVLNSNASGNGTAGLTSSRAGIRVNSLGERTRIDGNNITGNVTGIEIQSAGNLVVRNSASGNSMANFMIVVGNTVGPIVNAGNIGTSDRPHANYDY
ncbi:hypothetical protein RAS1_25470 [Phycisphaerae bacterium RAS1]|nr:hypothetical protein RAS1_25470 [Phycisphaerae bacterium RAS1]